MNQSPTAQVIPELALGHIVARCLHTIADFGVADALGDRPTTAAELATRTGMNADALGRMLRLLAAHNVFAYQLEEGYVHTPASKLLRSDHPQSLRSYVRMIGMPAIWTGVTNLAEPAKSGKPGIDGKSLMAHFAHHPEEASLFNQAMAAKSASVIPAVVETYEFSRFGIIADIGGGRGHLLEAILKAVPNASGVLFELPHVIADAAKVVSPRVQLVGGNSFGVSTACRGKRKPGSDGRSHSQSCVHPPSHAD